MLKEKPRLLELAIQNQILVFETGKTNLVIRVLCVDMCSERSLLVLFHGRQ
jgi:hypothetical protein